MVKKIDHKKQGKLNKARGARFEIKVRKDLEEKSWIVAKWMNNLDLEIKKLIQAKHKFQGIGRPMAIGTGFPDFICFKYNVDLTSTNLNCKVYEVIGVEVKSTGYLSKEEKEKCVWYLENKIFSQILIAFKSKERGKIEYKEFEYHSQAKEAGV
ncbi:hypothetical protein CL617_00640 [archaeon]|nr:hypothetical protein [archaeon]|tara:strand:+ start:4493 stop:4954 length:462 start_codon:yes stop_codon:yes gene_type:complete